MYADISALVSGPGPNAVPSTVHGAYVPRSQSSNRMSSRGAPSWPGAPENSTPRASPVWNVLLRKMIGWVPRLSRLIGESVHPAMVAVIGWFPVLRMV